MPSLWSWGLLLLLCRTAASVDRWCGKAYRPSDPAVDPGGRLDRPSLSPVPLLYLQVRPHVQPYIDEDGTGALIIDAMLTYSRRKAYNNILVDQAIDARLDSFSSISDVSSLTFNVYRSDTGRLLASDIKVKINSTGTLAGFSLIPFTPSFSPYNISIVCSDNTKYTASTQFLRLPSRTDGGSITKIDNLRGALLVNSSTDSSWKNSIFRPLFPYSFYLNGNWLVEDPGNMAAFRRYGYNVLHIVPAGGLGYNFTQLDEWLDEAERVGLWIMYDMRWTYQNSSLVEWQVNRLKARQKLLLWYTADEPDGQVDPLNAPKEAYDLIKSLDPYHPVSLCLNCENYHFEEYAAGADIILSDVYPVGTNTSWSTRYETVCNATYGCCGCDNCVGNNNLSNVPARLDTFRAYQNQLGLPYKPLWGTPQAFGNSEFWKQTPTEQELIVMNFLSINHGAMGIIMWTFPTTPELTNATSMLARMLILPWSNFMLQGELLSGLTIDGAPIADASAWLAGDWMLLSIVNPSHEEVVGPLVLKLPAGFRTSGFGMPGDGKSIEWRLPSNKPEDSDRLVKNGLPGLAVDIFAIMRDVEYRGGSGLVNQTS